MVDDCRIYANFHTKLVLQLRAVNKRLTLWVTNMSEKYIDRNTFHKELAPPRGKNKYESYSQNWFLVPLGFCFKISDDHSRQFYMGIPPPPPPDCDFQSLCVRTFQSVKRKSRQSDNGIRRYICRILD